MTLFRHTSWTGPKSRNYDFTNIVACYAETAPSEHFVPCTTDELNALVKTPVRPLYIQAGVEYYGYL